MTVLVVDHGHSTRCGIRDLGVRIAERLGAAHVDCNSMDEYAEAVEEHEAHAVIMNYRADLMPWWQPWAVIELAVLHQYGPSTVDARAAELLARGFDHVLVLDPTVHPSDPRVHAVGRPLPPAPSHSVTPPDDPRIGSFGYAFPHKGFADVAAEVATIPNATYVLHMPEAHFNGANGALLYTDGILAEVHARLDGHALEFTSNDLSPQDLVDRLAGNTVNCLLYAPGQPEAGLSSALDYLIAAGRPILVSDAEMFAAAEGTAAIWPARSLSDVVNCAAYWESRTKMLRAWNEGYFEAAVIGDCEIAVNDDCDDVIHGGRTEDFDWIRQIDWHSQAGQDEWVHSIIGDTGFFVDVGAHDGVVHSNTYALEQLGWTGICIEPNEAAYEELKANRDCEVAAFAISSVHGKIRFNGVQVAADAPWTACTTLTDLLNRVDAPPVIDYLSIDVEGHELEVLAGMDFDRWSVRVATIEHNLYLRGPEHRDAIRERMIGLGFILAGADVVAPGYGPYEDWWIHEAAL